MRYPIILKNLIKRTKKVQEKTTVSSKKYYAKTTVFLKRRPLTSFLLVLGLLFVVLIAGQLFQKKQPDVVQGQQVKSVKVFSIGESPKATFQAKIEKSGVVKIIAQAPGVVQSISVTQGDNVGQGQQIISLSSNYQGGNAASIQRQVAQTQYQNILDTFTTQHDLLNNQRDVATASADNAQKMRDIARQSLDETNSLITANQSQLDAMNQDLTALTAANPNDPTIPTLQGSINQLQGGINQLREAGRSIDFSSSNDNQPAKLANLQKDITLKQLDLQEKSFDLNKEVTRLQVSLASINEATMYPASPFAGRVERVYVHEGDLVSPGTLLATITGDSVSATAILTVPQAVAKVIRLGEPSILLIGDKKVAVTPYYVSSQATDGQLYSVFYDVPEKYQGDSANGEFVTISVPVNTVDATATDPFVPIDAVYQSQDSAFVLVSFKDVAESKRVTLGKVYGNYVEVLTGLKNGDQIILDRNVIAGDKVKIY